MVTLNKEEKESPTKHWAIILGGIVLILAVIGLGVGLTMSSHGKTQKSEVVKDVQVNNELNLQFAALFRHITADKICYDKSRGAFLIHFSKEIGERDNGESWHGWWFINSPQFNYIPENKTAYVFNISGNEYRKVWPNVEGLSCAEAKDFEGK